MKFYLLKMKYRYSLFGLLLLTGCKSVKRHSDIENTVIGTWEFVQTEDHNGVKLERYQGNVGVIEATGPKLIYKSNHTYRMIFRPENIDVGKWSFNEKTMTIEHDLFIDSTDWIGQDLIKRGQAIKQKDGKYYERINDKVLKFDKDEMRIDNRGLINVYKKVK